MAIETIGTRHNRLVENNIDRSGQERCFAKKNSERQSPTENQLKNRR